MKPARPHPLTLLLVLYSHGVLAQAPPGGSSSPVLEARAHLERAETAYKGRNYAAAIEEFQAGYALDPRREFLYGWAQAERLRGNCEEAISVYDRYLATRPGAAQVAAASENREICVQALRQAAQQTQMPPQLPRAEVVPQVAPPISSPVMVPEPRHKPSAWYRDPLTDILAGAAVAAAGTGLWLFLESSSDQDAAQVAATEGQARAQWDSAHTERTMAWVAVGSAAALLAAATVRWILHRPHASNEDSAISGPSRILSVPFTARVSF